MAIEPTLIAALDCSELERSVDAFLDAEFDERERAEAEAHLAGCPRCRDVVGGQARIRAALRAKLREAMAAPRAGRARPARRCASRLDAAPWREERRPLWRRALRPFPWPPSAAAPPASGGARLPLRQRRHLLVEDAIRKHHRELPLEVTMPPEAHAGLVRRQARLQPRPAALPRRRRAGGGRAPLATSGSGRPPTSATSSRAARRASSSSTTRRAVRRARARRANRAAQGAHRGARAATTWRSGARTRSSTPSSPTSTRTQLFQLVQTARSTPRT